MNGTRKCLVPLFVGTPVKTRDRERERGKAPIKLAIELWDFLDTFIILPNVTSFSKSLSFLRQSMINIFLHIIWNLFLSIYGEPPRQDTVWLVPFSLSVLNVRNGNFLASLDQTWVLFVILYKNTSRKLVSSEKRYKKVTNSYKFIQKTVMFLLLISCMLSIILINCRSNCVFGTIHLTWKDKKKND